MAVEKVNVYRRWLEPVPQENGKPIPKSRWSHERHHSWTVRWYGTTGKRYSKDFKTKKLAERCARDLQPGVGVGKQDRPEKIALHKFIQEHVNVMKGQVAYATLIDQARVLRLFEKHIGGSITLQEIKSRHAEGFIARRLACGLAVATVNKDIRTLRGIFNLAVDPRGYLSEGRNPFGRLKQRRKAVKALRCVTVKEYRALIKTARTYWWQVLISIAYCCGVRKNEILNLTWADIDFKNQLICVQAKAPTESLIEWEPKDHENRMVPLSDETTQLLADLQAESEEGSPYVFVSRDRLKRVRQRMSQNCWNAKSDLVNNMCKNFNAMRRRAAVAECSLHDLRRSAITNWAPRLPIQVVQQFARHSDITTTRRYYLTVRSEDVISASKIMNEILQGVKND